MDRIQAKIQSALRLDSASRRERRFSDADRSTTQPIIRSVSQTTNTSRKTMDSELVVEKASPEPLRQHQCPAVNCALLRTLATTELLEIILGFLNTKDVLNLRRTCRKWNDVTRESPSLRTHFFVHPQWDRHPENFELLGLKLPGLFIELGDAVELGRWIRIRMTSRAAHQICPDAGRRRRPRAKSIFEGLRGGLGSKPQQDGGTWPIRTTCEEPGEPLLKRDELLVVQPPIVNMQAFVTQSGTAASSSTASPEDQIEPTACAKLFCETGITLGFLADTAASLLSSSDSAAVVFKAIVSFSPPKGGKRRPERHVTYIS